MSDLLKKAVTYEQLEEAKIEKKSRPLFHLASRVGWMNDPNGFSYYDGRYHLFYQYHPYNIKWGPMHWGHAVSVDLITWEYLPVAIAPDQSYDSFGCFSGSAIELPSGEQLLLYTGVHKEDPEDDDSKDIQTQCIAIGDGESYKKIFSNPVLTEADLPEGSSRYDFRDPKIWEDEGTYYCVVGNCTEDKDGQILLFKSTDAIKWQFEKILIKNNNRFGKMWECPDFFELDGKNVLITSPQDMLPVGLEFHNGNGTLYISGECAEDYEFKEEEYGTIDYGIDFYAPQTTLTPDGRRVMIAWMQNWDTLSFKAEEKPKWFGQMTLPRELSLKNGRLYQQPVKELENYYGQTISHHNVKFTREVNLPGIEGRCIDLTVTVRPTAQSEMYKKFEIRFADNGKYYTSITYDPYESIIKLDRKHSGTRRCSVHQRRAYVRKQDGEFKIRLILDRFSMEAFINDGEQALSMTLYTDIAADGMIFMADGEVCMDAVMHELNIGE